MNSETITVQIATQHPCPPTETIIDWATMALGAQNREGDIVIRVIEEKPMLELNHHYRNKAYPTNVLSFPNPIPQLAEHMLGDIVICAAIVHQEALAQHKLYHAHFAHMVIHGVLHLLGFDHEHEMDAQKMEQLETTLLTQLGFDNPYEVKNFDE
jgi:probable rRNA maturation factor